MAEDCIYVTAAIFQITIIVRNREGHIAGFCLDIEIIEERNEIWVIDFVIDNKASIDWSLTLGGDHVYRIAVAADAIHFLKNGYVVALTKQPCGGQTSDATTDDGY